MGSSWGKAESFDLSSSVFSLMHFSSSYSELEYGHEAASSYSALVSKTPWRVRSIAVALVALEGGDVGTLLLSREGRVGSFSHYKDSHFPVHCKLNCWFKNFVLFLVCPTMQPTY